MDDRLSLPARFDNAAVPAVLDALLQRRNKPVDIDAGGVKFAGTLAIQLLVAAVRQWRADDIPFRVVSPGQALLESARVLGVDPVEIGITPDAEQAA